MLLLAVALPDYRATVKGLTVFSSCLFICMNLCRRDLHPAAILTFECQKMAVRAGLYVPFLMILSWSLPGVPKQHRGEVWKFLSEQHSLRQTVSSPPAARNTPYKELLQQVSSEQHAILIDLGNADMHYTLIRIPALKCLSHLLPTNMQ